MPPWVRCWACNACDAGGPTGPQPPPGAPWADQMRYIEALYMAVRVTQTEHHIVATRRLADVQEEARRTADKQVLIAARMVERMMPVGFSGPPKDGA